jgi:glucosyl-3-phosphoglycerate synthase
VGKDRAVPATYPLGAFGARAVLEACAGRTVSVCVPAHDEESTVGGVVRAALGAGALVHEVLVVDDGSTDATADAAARAGARVVRLEERRGKGGAMRTALAASSGDIVVYLDADVENTTAGFVTALVGPVALFGAALVKGYYERPLDGAPTGGGRVNELVARPLLEVLFPQLAWVRQPLAGETAAPRAVFERVGFAEGYGVEIALLVDVAAVFGEASIAQVDLGTRVHRNRPLESLRPQAVEVLRAALGRAGAGEGEGAGGGGAAPGDDGDPRRRAASAR